MLDLDEQWAHCVDLPAGFTAGSGVLGLRDPGRYLYAVDVVTEGVAVVDTGELTVVRTGEIDITAPPSSAATIATSGDRLYLGVGSEVIEVDPISLEGRGRLPRDATVVDLGAAGSDELFVIEQGAVEVIDTGSGDALARFELPELVAPSQPVPTIDPARVATECAC